MSYANNLVKAPVNQYDVQRALGVASGEWGVLCTHANINPMAKFKPVRLNQKEDLTLAQFTSVRFGFSSVTPMFTGGVANPSCTWVYEKPRGLANNDHPTNEHYRITDFDGYLHRACVPFAFGVSGALQDGLGLWFYKNNMAATYYNDQGGNVIWDSDYGLSLSELFAYSSNASDNSYITVCIHDLTRGDHVVVETNKKLRDLTTSVDTITLYPTARTISGVSYHAVAMLNDSTRNGNNFRIIVGLMNSNTNPSAPYQVFDDSTTPNPSGITLYSLAFMEGIDRKELQLWSLHTIMGLKCTLGVSSYTMTYVGEADWKNNGMPMIKYLLSANVVGSFVTPSDHWSPEDGDIAVRIAVSANGLVGDDAVQGNIEVGTTVNIPNAGQTYTFNLYSFSDIPVYYYHGTGSFDVYFNAFAKEIQETIPFENTVTIHPS